MNANVDLLGRPTTDAERALLEVYDRLKALVALPDLAPCVESNARAALATVWQAVNDLALRFEPLDSLRA